MKCCRNVFSPNLVAGTIGKISVEIINVQSRLKGARHAQMARPSKHHHVIVTSAPLLIITSSPWGTFTAVHALVSTMISVCFIFLLLNLAA